MKIPPQSRFSESFIRANGLENDEFNGWYLRPGMLFQASDRWWGDGKKRQRLHEGLDLAFYRARKNQVVGFTERTRIPNTYDGVVVGIFDDLLGKSIFVKHEITHVEDGGLCTIFGHTKPDRKIHSGKKVKQGEIIAEVAGTEASNVPLHLHLSVGWAKKITADILDWNVIGTSETLKLINPIDIIGMYSLDSTPLSDDESL